MDCPGEHSMMVDFDVTFTDDFAKTETLDWTLSGFDARFKMLTLAVYAPGCTGIVTAFERPKGTAQPGMAALKARAPAQTLKGAKALIIGGSGGLGELSGKLLAARGADVTLTYHRGDSEAQAVCADITGAGGKAACRQFDITQPGYIGAFTRGQDIILYFATPGIFRGSRAYSPALHAEFIEFYNNGFWKVVQAAASGNEKTVLFYPSTTAIDEQTDDMIEYAAAKSAGEYMCGYWDRQYSNLSIVCSRLPRLPTDQTANVVPIPFQYDPVAVMTDVIVTITRAYETV